MVKLICIDLDGTALLNDHKTMCPELLDALDKAWEQGIAIAPVTGRQFHLLPDFFKTHPKWEDLVVLCNGAQVRRLSDGAVFHSLSIPADALHKILTLAECYDLPLEFSIDSRLHLTPRSLEKQQGIESLRFHRETILASHGKVVPSLEPFCDAPVEKINLMCIGPDIREEVVRELEKIDVSAVFASSSSMEITHSGATKGRGLEALCRLRNIPMEAVMALGDSGNDLAMLRAAGLGIAMGNAPDYVKAAADAVTETNENHGAALAVRRYALSNK